MLTSEVHLPTKVDFRLVERLVEACCQSSGLTMKVKGSLSKYPDSIYWHFKEGTLERGGTLEVTLWRGGRRLWLSVQAGRTGTWTQDAMVKMKPTLEMQLKQSVSL